MGGTIATSVIIFDVPGNLASSCYMSLAFSTRFLLDELAVFAGGSESTFALPDFLNKDLLSNFSFISLIFPIAKFDHLVPFRVPNRYATLRCFLGRHHDRRVCLTFNGG